MGKLMLSIFLVALVVQTQALPRNLKLWPIRIVGGTEAPLGSVPHQISLRINGNHACGGSIYNENYVITAAHCGVAGTTRSFSVRAGINRLDNSESANSQTVKVSDIRVHENYDDWTVSNDIAILKLATPLILSKSRRTASIKIPPAGYAATGDVTVTGWGTTTEGGSIPNALRTVTVPVVSDADCRKAYSRDEILDSMICAGLSAGGKDSCQGDSGGPLVDSNGLLVGVVSWGYGCAQRGYPGVYTETSHFHQWILDHTK